MMQTNEFVSLSGDIELNFSLAKNLDVGHSLVLVFPSEYGNLRTTDLACTLSPIVSAGVAAEDTIQSPECTSTAKTIIAPITADLEEDTSYKLVIKGVIGPEFENCQSKKPTFGIIDADKDFTHVSAENSINMASPAF